MYCGMQHSSGVQEPLPPKILTTFSLITSTTTTLGSTLYASVTMINLRYCTREE